MCVGGWVLGPQRSEHRRGGVEGVEGMTQLTVSGECYTSFHALSCNPSEVRAQCQALQGEGGRVEGTLNVAGFQK